jgi:hypothetical protein
MVLPNLELPAGGRLQGVSAQVFFRLFRGGAAVYPSQRILKLNYLIFKKGYEKLRLLH